jgi:glycosyltransferase involved in cell wall biosynthesis
MREGTVAYVLKSFPRLSETFIASEIYRLEQQGVPIRLFVMKRSNEPFAHPIVDAIRSPRVHLPHTDSISGVSALIWLTRHYRRFAGAFWRQARRHPLRVARVARLAAGHAVRARKGPFTLRKSPLKEFLQAVAVADAISRAGDVRRIHAHFCHSATTVAWWASLMMSLPLSFTAHAKDVYCADLNPAGLLARKLAAARFVVTCTQANRAYLQAMTTTPVYCVYHGLDVSFARLSNGIHSSRHSRGRIQALAVGRLVAKKGLDVFIEACAMLRDRGVAIAATIVGESGDQETALRQLVIERGLHDVVVFTGPLPQRELFDQYQKATVFCLPCRVVANGDRDGIPNVMAEAMACGLPVVTTSVSGIPELLSHEANGLLVTPDDPVAVADAMETLHRNPRLAERLSQKARADIRERFDGDAGAQRLSRLLVAGAA